MPGKLLSYLLAGLALIIVIVVVLLLAGRDENSPDQADDGPRLEEPAQDSDDEPIYPFGDFSPTYIRKPATDKEKDEDTAEIKRMHQELPGNYWLPPVPGEENTVNEAEKKFVSDLNRLQKKVKNKSATPEEKKEYVVQRKKIAQDKIDLINYYIKRTSETPGQNWFTPDDVQSGRDKISDLKLEIDNLDKSLQ